MADNLGASVNCRSQCEWNVLHDSCRDSLTSLGLFRVQRMVQAKRQDGSGRDHVLSKNCCRAEPQNNQEYASHGICLDNSTSEHILSQACVSGKAAQQPGGTCLCQSFTARNIS